MLVVFHMFHTFTTYGVGKSFLLEVTVHFLSQHYVVLDLEVVETDLTATPARTH